MKRSLLENPSKNPVFTENPYRRLLRALLRSTYLLKSLLRTLLRVACCCMTLLETTFPLTSAMRFGLVRMWSGCGSDVVRTWFGCGSDVFSDLVQTVSCLAEVKGKWFPAHDPLKACALNMASRAGLACQDEGSRPHRILRLNATDGV